MGEGQHVGVGLSPLVFLLFIRDNFLPVQLPRWLHHDAIFIRITYLKHEPGSLGDSSFQKPENQRDAVL